jgi:hypothetical protein
VSALDRLGFEGLLAAGHTPAEAWTLIRESLADAPESLAAIRRMAGTAEGREALEWSRKAWARHGFRPPWEAP